MNNAINPVNLPLELMRVRSRKIRDARAMEKNASGLGGLANPAQGMVCVPTKTTAYERTIRYHEALHIEHTPAESAELRTKDMLDQALEDARIHRYCGKAKECWNEQARRDEVCTALMDVRGVRQQISKGLPLNVSASIVLLRARAILLGNPKYDAIVESTVSTLGKDAVKDFHAAIFALEDTGGNRESAGWKRARRLLKAYFAEDFRTEAPSMGCGASKTESGKESGEEGGKEEATKSSESESEIGESKQQEDKNESGESRESSDSGEDSDGGEIESAGTDASPKLSEPKPPKKPVRIAKDKESKKPSKESTLERSEESYSDKLETPFDKELKSPKPKEKYELAYPQDIEFLRENYPLDVRIKRFDMAGNRVSCTHGMKQPAPTLAGSRIISSRLATAMCNPCTRIFRRPLARGLSGTILVDASGSMHIPIPELEAFCAKVPLVTVAFYNAPSDSYGTEWCEATHGNIYIYAVNGFRALRMPNWDILRGQKWNWGGGNLIDYQALAWLLKQPGPRYMITDIECTGPWARVASKAINLAAQRKMIELRWSLTETMIELQRRNAPRESR